tara:strand:+ start:379 stop:564 length:186 start_codon:yes stop_codon:yes gene_type:complete
MSLKKLAIEFDKPAIKMLLSALDQYEQTLPLGSSNKRERYCDIYRTLKISLFELIFMEGSP